MNDTELSFGKRLRTSRLLADLDQEDMAKLLGVARSTVSGWERGLAEPNATHFVIWAQLTRQPLEWFADGIDTSDERLERVGEQVDLESRLRESNSRPFHYKVWSRFCELIGWNRPCPICRQPLVWGVCDRPHEAAAFGLAA